MAIRIPCLTVIFIQIAAVSAAVEPVPLIDIHPGLDVAESPGPNQYFGFDEPNIDGTWGWTFFVKSPIVVTHVAWYDESGDGLSHSHRIGLWKDLSGIDRWPFIQTSGNYPRVVVNAEQLLGIFPPFLTDGIVIPEGIAADLDGVWRKVALPVGPILLQPGGYALGGLDDTNSTDAIRYVLDDLATYEMGNSLPADPRIQIGAPGHSDLTGFQAPSMFFLVGGVELGPMLFIEPIPEPCAGILMLLACIGVTLGRLTNRSS